MIELAVGVVVIVLGTGGAGVAIAWLNDRRHAAKARHPQPDAKTVLQHRFAKGEIDEAEFTSRMHVLTYGPPLELHDAD